MAVWDINIFEVDKIAKLRWDAREMRFHNNPEADTHIHRPYRDGWSLPE